MAGTGEAGATRPRRKLMAVSSGGGHWVQLRRLTPAFADCDVFYASTDSALPAAMRGSVYYRIPDATQRDRLAFLPLAVRVARILLKERPDVVVSTGAAPGLVALALAKLMLRSRTIWIDSIANVEQMSTAGRLARRVADVWLTQWEPLSRPGGPEHWGAVL
jgi:UDP-N-acetylglucosamine:LPS N-acetylglucosamine transferase